MALPISFVFDSELLLYEHQSTFNPNMPLRDLLYVTRVLQNRIKDKNLYSNALIKIPAPRAVEKAVDYCIKNEIL